jgi:hypothetical protein
MKMKIQVVIEHDEGQVEDVQQVACLRRGPFTPEELGLNLAEARQMLQYVQNAMVTSQAAEYIGRQQPCPRCSDTRSQKGRHEIVFRTLFGKLRLDRMRLHHCYCDPRQPAGTCSPLSDLRTNDQYQPHPKQRLDNEVRRSTTVGIDASTDFNLDGAVAGLHDVVIGDHGEILFGELGHEDPIPGYAPLARQRIPHSLAAPTGDRPIENGRSARVSVGAQKHDGLIVLLTKAAYFIDCSERGRRESR